MELGEFGCYLGSLVSAFIAFKLFKIERLTFVNQMFLVYFALDSIWGSAETFLLFKLQRERFEAKINTKLKVLNIDILFSGNGNDEIQMQNCAYFISIWMSSLPNRAIYHTGMVFCRL